MNTITEYWIIMNTSLENDDLLFLEKSVVQEVFNCWPGVPINNESELQEVKQAISVIWTFEAHQRWSIRVGLSIVIQFESATNLLASGKTSLVLFYSHKSVYFVKTMSKHNWFQCFNYWFFCLYSLTLLFSRPHPTILVSFVDLSLAAGFGSTALVGDQRALARTHQYKCTIGESWCRMTKGLTFCWEVLLKGMYVMNKSIFCHPLLKKNISHSPEKIPGALYIGDWAISDFSPISETTFAKPISVIWTCVFFGAMIVCVEPFKNTWNVFWAANKTL